MPKLQKNVHYKHYKVTKIISQQCKDMELFFIESEVQNASDLVQL